eukprot:1285908-Alexandrium_andersonii.AAC.1
MALRAIALAYRNSAHPTLPRTCHRFNSPWTAAPAACSAQGRGGATGQRHRLLKRLAISLELCAIALEHQATHA